MTILGRPIPQGFTVTTEACTDYYNSGKQITEEIQNQIFEALTWLEGVNGKKFGDTEGSVYWFLFVPVQEHPCRV